MHLYIRLKKVLGYLGLKLISSEAKYEFLPKTNIRETLCVVSTLSSSLVRSRALSRDRRTPATTDGGGKHLQEQWLYVPD